MEQDLVEWDREPVEEWAVAAEAAVVWEVDLEPVREGTVYVLPVAM